MCGKGQRGLILYRTKNAESKVSKFYKPPENAKILPK